MKNTILFLLILPSFLYPQINSDFLNNSTISIGSEYMANSEIGLNGQYHLKNGISLGLNARYCKHSEGILLIPSFRYYFNENKCRPYVDVRYGKLHYNQEWSKYVEDSIEYWDPTVGGFVSTPHRYKKSGEDKIATPALSISGSLEYFLNNFGFYSSLGFSHFTKIDGSFSDKTKLFYVVGASYYLNKK